MINEIIQNKINQATAERPAMRAFLEKIIVHEQQHGNYTQKYKTEIKNAVKQEEEK